MNPRSIALGVGLVLSSASRPAEGGPPEPPPPLAEVEAPLDFTGGLKSSGAAHAPLLRRDELVDVEYAADGRVFCVGRKAVYVAQAGRWRIIVSGVKQPLRDSTVGPNDVLFLVGERGTLLKLDEKGMGRQLASGLGTATNRADWERVWYSAGSSRLWIRAGKDRLVAVRIPGGEARTHRIPEPAYGSMGVGSGQALLRGRVVGGKDEVVVSMGRGLYLYTDEGGLRYVADAEADIDNIEFAPPLDRIEVDVTTTAGTKRVAMIPSADAGVAPLGESETRTLHEAQRRARWRRDQASRAAGHAFWFPTVRVAPGVNVPVTDGVRAAFGIESGLGFVLDPLPKPRRDDAGAPTFWIWPEFGHQWVGNDGGGHGVHAGVGLGGGTDFFAGFYTPRFVASDLESGQARPGLRHGASFQVLWGTVGVELSHGMRFGRDQTADHDVRASLSVNLAMLVWVAILMTQE